MAGEGRAKANGEAQVLRLRCAPATEDRDFRPAAVCVCYAREDQPIALLSIEIKRLAVERCTLRTEIMRRAADRKQLSTPLHSPNGGCTASGQSCSSSLRGGSGINAGVKGRHRLSKSRGAALHTSPTPRSDYTRRKRCCAITTCAFTVLRLTPNRRPALV